MRDIFIIPVEGGTSFSPTFGYGSTFQGENSHLDDVHPTWRPVGLPQ
jgi:hypothetical protein